MGVVEDDFYARSQEIEVYLDYLTKLELRIDIDVSLMATMKASAMLMIYNLMESTVTSAIESIYDHLREQGIAFTSVSEKLKVMVLIGAKKRNPKKLVEKMKESVLDLAVAAFERADIFSGNVDSRMIREVWDSYGISRTDGYEVDVLLEVKSARNDLAHGTKSFSDLGKSLTASELIEKFKATKTLLYCALKDVERHILLGLVDAGAAA